jgi:SAM-dependent methyltransferase
LQLDVFAFERHIRVRKSLVIGSGEAEHAVELDDVVDVATGKERHGDLVRQDFLRLRGLIAAGLHRCAYCAQVTAPLVLRAGDIVAERPEGTADDIHFTEALAASVIGYASQPGDLVLDPFAGYGTTVTVAERMGRRAIGIELVPQHLEIARRRTAGGARLILGDARELSRLVDEPLDLVLTSPPYMPSRDHPQNPLAGYATTDGDYAVYLHELGSIFGQVAILLRPGGRLVVNVANVVATDGGVTPLASDLAAVIDEHVPLLGVTTLQWDEPPAGLDGDYLLWFARPDAEHIGPMSGRPPPVSPGGPHDERGTDG